MRVLIISTKRGIVGLEGLIDVQYLKPVPGTLEVPTKCEVVARASVAACGSKVGMIY